MTEQLVISADNKEDLYLELFPQVEALIANETDMIANMANFVSALYTAFNWLWIGFYIVKENQLVLGPFQGPVACTRINYAKGVCGSAWEKNTIQIVPDVNAFPGHIACSSLSKSEIVLPLIDHGGNVFAVLDVDSDKLNDFDNIDALYLSKFIKLINRDLSE